jgi:hypothetical protein
VKYSYEEQAILAPEVFHQADVGQMEAVVAVGDMRESVGEMVAVGINVLTVDEKMYIEVEQVLLSHAAVHQCQ